MSDATIEQPRTGELTNSEIDQSSIKVLAFRWLSRQGVVVVLLFALLGGLASFGHYTMTTAVPAHLKQIQDGYERLSKDHKEANERMATAVEKVVEDGRAQRKEFLDLIREYRGSTATGS